MTRALLTSAVALSLIVSSFAQAPTKPSAKPATARRAPAKPAAPASAQAATLPSQEVVNSFMRRMFGYDANVKWEILDISPSEVPGLAHVVVMIGNQGRATHLYVSANNEWAIVGDVLPFGADPFVKVRRQLDERATGPAKGPKDAPITIVEFTDLQCPSCKNAEPTLQRLITDIPNVRFVVQQFPLMQIHPWAFKAATWGHCVGQKDPDAYFRFADLVYQAQSTITEANADEKLREAATSAGVDAIAMETCAKEPTTAAAVRASMDFGRALGVSGTPTLFINGRKVSGINSMPYDTLKAMVQFELEQAQKAPGTPVP